MRFYTSLLAVVTLSLAAGCGDGDDAASASISAEQLERLNQEQQDAEFAESQQRAETLQ